ILPSIYFNPRKKPFMSYFKKNFIFFSLGEFISVAGWLFALFGFLVNSEGGKHDQRGYCVHSIIAYSCNIGGAHSMTPCVRNAFIITSADGTSDGEVLRYDQSFALRMTAGFDGELFLASDHKTFLKCAKKSRLQELSLVEEFDFLCWWKVIYFDPQERLENEGYPVQVNSKVLISHCKTNQCLAALVFIYLFGLSLFGKEYELTARTFLDSHKAERDSNYWLLMQLQQDSDTTDDKQEDTQIKECS
uniref:Cilia and flagella associated protein 161 n=1 Tax=Cyprinus carpio TaxID=7962 RepID=A0A8C2K4I1_CYPCA